MGWKMDVRRGLAAAVVTLLVTTGLSFYVDHQDRSVRGREIQVRSALEVALRNQKELSSMLLIAVLEQNPLRLKNFEAVNAELELAMQSIAALNRNPQFSDEIVALTERHRGLLQVTRNAMTLMHNGHWREARQVMVDDGYVRNASMQEIDLRSTVEALNSTLAAQADLFDMFRTVGTLLRVGSIALLLWVGARYSRQLREEVETQRRIQAELTESRMALRDLATHEQAKRDDERKQLAQEIHDELGQRLTVLRMDVAMLPRAVQGDAAQTLHQQVTKLKGDIDDLFVIVRNLAGQLRPAAMDVGLVAAVEALLQDFENALQIPCELDNRWPEPLRLDERRSSAVFRILQESLTNAARHARATHIKVSLEVAGGQLRVRVQDNGRGFVAPGWHTFGLTGLRERALSVGGSAHIASQPGVGTTVEATIPLEVVMQPEPAVGPASSGRESDRPAA
jgi:signal transduction histidine kinase